MPRLILKPGSRPPWVGLAAAVWVQMAAGSGATFPLYSAALKSVLGFNQQQVTILGVANDFGENVGLLPGYACNKLPPWAVLLVGAVACFLGFGVLWLAVTETVQGLPFWLLFLALVIATNGNSWFNTAVLVTNMRNFPLSRGTVGGLLKGYVGISGAAYTVLYSMMLSHSASNLLLLLTVGVPILCLVVMYFVRPCTPSGEDSSEHVHFTFVLSTSILLATYLLVTTIVSEVVSLTSVVKYVLLATMVVLLMSPLAIPIKMTFFRANSRRNSPLAGSSDNLIQEDSESTEKEPFLTHSSSASYLGSLFDEDPTDMEILLAEGEGAVKKKRKPRRGEDFKFGEAFVKADFWLLWFVYFLGTGSGITVSNNLAQIGFAFGAKDTTIILCLFSFCNFIGRLTSGSISEHFVRSRTLPRTLWMGVAQFFMAITFLIFAISLKHTLYIATALLGIGTGFQFLSISTVSELFGLKHFGINFNFILLGNPIGATIFSAVLAGHVYDMEAEKQGSQTCIGPDCFRLTFLVLAGACGLGTLLSIILTVRIRPVYQALYASGSFRLPHTSSSDH
ncbi:PREDICTED: protein NUCLEAR FUSION DEFECTIVE 4 [Tarenaya hassleriana]|uniref:protein NUCLEAR FUSION DEFECTIVE 4 n=1 Tax=Tarenaya hassleriana TaxID=28532 RepID=UPI00053C6D7A|nr:PREDICTED: protein NUCLEAR FUSION DEFECTIVE 4 [Tarenaya hassleriana]